VAAHPARSLCTVSLSESRPAGCGLCSSVDHRKSIIIGRWPNEMREYLSAPCGVCSALGAIACLVLFGDLSPGQAPSCYVDGSLAPPRTLSYLDRIPNLTRPRLSASPHHDINIIVNTTRCPTGNRYIMGRGLSERGTMGTIDGTNKTTIYTKTNIYTTNFTRQWSKQKFNLLFTRLLLRGQF
jgi:hypothetical protein